MKIKPIILLITLALALLVSLPRASLATSGYALQFYGNGTGDIDRVKIQIEPHVNADVGGDFTIEFWMKSTASDGTCAPSTSAGDGWISGRIIVDRDVYGGGDYGDYGVSLAGGRICFGVALGSAGATIYGSTNVADGQWHHIAITRQSSSGQMRIFVDGQLQKSQNGPTGNLSYRDGRGTSYPNSDPYLVIAAEKHDYDPGTYPSFTGWIDELRISTSIRYTTNFTRPNQPFAADSAAVALYHFDNTPAACTGQVNDSSGQNNHGDCKFGGTVPNQGPQYVLDSPFTSSIIYNHKIHLPLVRR